MILADFPVTANQGAFLKNAYELLNLRALKFSVLNELHIFHCMSKIFSVRYQRMEFNTKYVAHTLKIEFLCNIQVVGFRCSDTFFKRLGKVGYHAK